VHDVPLGAHLRAARIRRGWRQVDLASVAGVSRTTVARIETGRVEELTVKTLRKVGGALEVSLQILPRSRGAELDRTVNARHAALAEAAMRRLRSQPGWVVRPEVSFSIWGERGIVDLLAWHEASRSIVVIELKTAIIDVGELLGTLDRKRRLARRIAASVGWAAEHVSVALIVAEGSTNRRRIADHGDTFRAALPDGGSRWRAWLRMPAGEVRALTFVSDVRPGNIRSGFATRQRVPTRANDRRAARPRTNRPSQGPVGPVAVPPGPG